MKYLFLLLLCLVFIKNGFSQTIFNKDTLTVLADSLQQNGDYDEALSLRIKAIKLCKNASKEYQTYLESKYLQSKSVKFEYFSYNYHNPDKFMTKKAREQYLDSALQFAIKAKELYKDAKRPDRRFQYDIQNRIYHQTAYLGNWKHALQEAQLGLTILKDTLSKSDKKFVDLIYDIGYIYSQLGDYTNAVKNYQASLDLYKKNIGENNSDVAQAYNNIAVEYRNLGLRKKELESLLKAKNIWESLNKDDDKQFLYRCYGNLFYWYSYYGDFEKAESYVLKKQNLRVDKFAKQLNGFLRNEEEIYKDKLFEWYDLMLHFSRKNDTVKTTQYAQNIINTINSDNKLLDFETSIISSTLKFYASLVKDTNYEESLELLDKAINIQEKYKSVYFTNPLPFQLEKVELLINKQQFKEANIMLNNLSVVNGEKDISLLFRLALLKGRTSQELNNFKDAEVYFNTAFSVLNNSDASLENCTIENLKPLISFETIYGFLQMGDFYFQQFKIDNSKTNLEKATYRYLLASNIYKRLYLGDRYNERLFTMYNEINERLLNIALNQNNNEKILNEIINAIENNGSKLTWSKFVFNNKRLQLKAPEMLVNQEENIKSQLNFYQKALVNADAESDEKLKLWKNKIYELKESLTKIQDSIKYQNPKYYQLHVKDFDISELQKTLNDNEAILKYLFTTHQLFSFLISNKGIQLVSVSNKESVLNILKSTINNLKNRNHNYEITFARLKPILFNETPYQDYRKLIIIPDGALHYLPFEALDFSTETPIISYASSLLLLQEQQGISPKLNDVKVGAFTGSNSNYRLPEASNEVINILKILKGNEFLNASKKTFLKNANQYNVLHLAMHSYIDEVHPEFSSLNFYGKKDSELFISELYNEAFKANMVVLSACDTGYGFYENGEGVISISRAFNYAGIPSTVMSLWKVDDEATSKIMTSFYKHLNEGETKDEALKNAKLDYLENTDDPLLKHPYYWSGFVLTGNAEALLESHNYWIYLSLLPLMIIWSYRKRLFQFFKK